MNYIKISEVDYVNLKDKSGMHKVITLNCDVFYRCNKLIHRTSGASVIFSNGDKFYHYNGIPLSRNNFINYLSNDELKQFLLNRENF